MYITANVYHKGRPQKTPNFNFERTRMKKNHLNIQVRGIMIHIFFYFYFLVPHSSLSKFDIIAFTDIYVYYYK